MKIFFSVTSVNMDFDDAGICQRMFIKSAVGFCKPTSFLLPSVLKETSIKYFTQSENGRNGELFITKQQQNQEFYVKSPRGGKL